MKQRILIIADDVSLRATLARWLMAAGYAVEVAESAKRAREVLAHGEVALAVVDPDGLNAIDDLISSLAAEVGRVLHVAGSAEQAGDHNGGPGPASGVIAKPLRETEVVATVAAAIKVGPDVLRFDGYTLDAARRTCHGTGGVEVPLTPAELSMLLALVRARGCVLSRDDLSKIAIGRAAERDDRSVDVLISRLRRKIEPDPKVPRMIVTVPGEGYKFALRSPAAAAMTEPGFNSHQASALRTTDAPAGEAAVAATSPARRGAPVAALRVAVVAAAVAGSAGIGSLLAFWYLGSATPDVPTAIVATSKFDATVIPLVNDTARKELASYAARPDVKALAISGAPGNGWGVGFGAPDAESAKREALERCRARSASRICRIYTVGMDVVWTPAAVPMPMAADIHLEPVNIPLDVADIPLVTDATRKEVIEKYVTNRLHKALALRPGVFYFNTADSTAEAERLAIERCGDFHQAPCLLLAADGMLTIQLPKSRPITDIFMLATQTDMSAQDKQRIGEIYRGKDWRALARGAQGWHPVANLPSEVVAVEAALALCEQRDTECRLHAISNFRVADK